MRTETSLSLPTNVVASAQAEVTECDGSAHAERAEHEHALMLALAGRPELLLGVLSSEVRARTSATRALDVRNQSLVADNAERTRADAMRAAEEAAEKASGFLGISGAFGKIVGVATAIASVAATVATGGAAIAIAGAVLLASAGPLSHALVKEGVVPPGVGKALELGLSVTGAILLGMAPVASAASAANVVAEAAESTALVARAVAFGATASQSLAKIGVAIEERNGDVANARAVVAEQHASHAFDQLSDDIDATRSMEASHARILRQLQQAVAARGDALSAATSLRV